MENLAKTVEIDGKIFGIKKQTDTDNPCGGCYFWKQFTLPCPKKPKCYDPESIIFIEL